MKITYAEGVFEELVNLSAYIAEDNETAAQRFLDACDETFRFLSQNPKIGSPREFENATLNEVRMWRIKGFEKYLIFYLPTDSGIEILHVFHGALDYNRVFADE